MDNKVNGLCHEIKFEICVKNIIIIIIFIIITIHLPQHFFFAKADTKKHRYASAKASAFPDCQGEFQMLDQLQPEKRLGITFPVKDVIA